jgi:uncharacterized protein (TIGR02145 family)
VITGAFTTINWTNGPYFIKTEIDPTGGTTYTISGASQVLSVPYALYAKTAESINGGITETDPLFNASVAKGIKTSDTAKWNAKSNFSGNYTDLKNKPTLLDNTTVVITSGNQTIGGNKTFRGTTKVSTPVNDSDAVTKAYADALLAKLSALENSLVTYGFNAKDIDGNIYHSAKIGTQVWMAENLRTTKYNDGTPIPNITDNNTWKALKSGAYADFENNPANSSIYGKLYNYYTVVDARKLCPSGWHVPSYAEWTTLITYLGGEMVAGAKLKETGTSHWESPNDAADNSAGFTALPGGFRDDNGMFWDLEIYGNWWTSTENDTSNAYLRFIYCFGNYVSTLTSRSKTYGCSVRCLQN